MRSQPLFQRVFDRVTRPPVLTVFAILQACLLGLVLVGHFATLTDPKQGDGELGTGDFLAFFTGAVLVQEGRGSELYDFGAQQAVQEAVTGVDSPVWQPYLNPPALAIALAPTTRLGYVASFLIFTAGLVVILVVALVFLLRATPGLAGSRLSAATALLLTIAHLPIALTVFGGQNTALTLALLCGIYAALRRESPIVAGVLLGLLTFKPQYAVVLGVVLLARRQIKVVAVGSLVGILHYGIGAAACGVDWPLDFLSAMAIHGPSEMADNAQWHFSLPTVVRRWFPGGFGWLGVVLLGAAALGLLLRVSRLVSRDSSRFPAFFGMVVATTLLLSPHLQYYEAGILALPALLGLETILTRGESPSLKVKALLSAGYLGFPLWQLSGILGFQPLAGALAVVFFWTRHLALSSHSKSPHLLSSETNP